MSGVDSGVAWLDHLAQAGHADNYDEAIGGLLKVMANLAHNSVNLITGPEAMLYAPWIRDGLSMDSRLIIHFDPSHQELQEAVQQQVNADIRVAGHQQELAAFLKDIQKHRFNLVVADRESLSPGTLDQLLSMVLDNGILALLLSNGEKSTVEERLSDEYFCSSPADSTRLLLVTRKGKQHRLQRRGARRRQG